MRTAVSYHPVLGFQFHHLALSCQLLCPKVRWANSTKSKRFKQSKNKQPSELHEAANVKRNSFCGVPHLKRVYVMWGTVLRAWNNSLLCPTGIFRWGMCFQSHQWDATSFDLHPFEWEFHKGWTEQHCTQSLAIPKEALVSSLLWHNSLSSNSVKSQDLSFIH